MATSWSLARRVVLRQMCTLRRYCVEIVEISTVKVCGIQKKFEWWSLLYSSSDSGAGV